MGNKTRSKRGYGIMLTGTGMMITDAFARMINGWPFRTVTEDYECYCYCVYNRINMLYYEKAVTFTEEALGWKENDMRRVRWMAGFR